MLSWKEIPLRLKEIGEGNSLLILFLKVIGRVFIKIKMISLNNNIN